MLVFGMGLYELFVSNLDIAKSLSEDKFHHRSNLFGLFTLKVSLSIYTFFYSIMLFLVAMLAPCKMKLFLFLFSSIWYNVLYFLSTFSRLNFQERPRWLEIKTVNELKTKLGHVIVMLLLIGLFDKSKKAVINSPVDLLCFSASVLLSSGCLFLLSKLNGAKWKRKEKKALKY